MLTLTRTKERDGSVDGGREAALAVIKDVTNRSSSVGECC